MLRLLRLLLDLHGHPLSWISPTTRRLLGLFRPHAGRLALAGGLMIAQACVPATIVWLVQRVLDDALIQRDAAMLAVLPFAISALYALNGGLTLGRGLLTRAVSWDVVTELRRALMASLLGQELSWHQRQPTGALLARVMGDVGAVQYAVSGVVTAIQKPITLVLLLVSAFLLDARLAGVALVVLPLFAWPIAALGARLRRAARAGQDHLARLTASTAETLSGVALVHSAQGEAARLQRFDRDNQAARDAQVRAAAAQLLPGPVVELGASLGVGLVLWIGGQRVLADEMAPGELIAFLVALGLLNDPLKGVAQIHALLTRASVSAAAVFEIIDRAPTVPDAGRVVLNTRAATLRLEGVSFRYPPRPEEPEPPWVLQGVDLTLQPGRVVALVGPSGSGKSTLAGLILRAHDPTLGRVSIDGQDLRELTLASLRRHVAVVSQDSFLWDDTVLENIRFGVEATPSEVEAAARAADAHDFIQTLPRGYDTRIDELGSRLSAGQRQRLCIARALLRDAPILVLDEATSALDAETEASVQAALRRLMAGRAVLAIAHRLATVVDAHEIVVLEGGRIVERGAHAALLAAGGTYARHARHATGPAGAGSPDHPSP